MKTDRNLDLLEEASLKLPFSQRDIFRDCLLGALSGYVSEEDWVKAIEFALSMVMA